MSFLNNLFGVPINTPATRSIFEETYTSFPVAVVDKNYLEKGDKILLPMMACEMLIRMEISYPMLFKLTNPLNGRHIHSGVMEFTAEEGMAYVPYWMLEYLGLGDGGEIKVTNVSLPKGNFVQFQAHDYVFAQLANPRAVLERALRNFATLTEGTTISIEHANNIFQLDVVSCKPSPAITVIETDLNVDFLPPKNIEKYEAMMRTKQKKDELRRVFENAASMRSVKPMMKLVDAEKPSIFSLKNKNTSNDINSNIFSNMNTKASNSVFNKEGRTINSKSSPKTTTTTTTSTTSNSTSSLPSLSSESSW